MRFDGLLGDEQGLGDLSVRAAGRGEFGHASLARRERLHSGVLRGPRSHPDCRKLGARPTLQGSGAAAGGEREPFEQGLPSCGALSGGSQRCAQVRTTPVRAQAARGRWRQHLERRFEPLRSFRARTDERLGAQRDADRAWRAEDRARRTSSEAKLRASS